MKIFQPTTGGGEGGGPVTGLTGNPTEIVYIDNAGNGTGDAFAIRDSVTFNTQITKPNGAFNTGLIIADVFGGADADVTYQSGLSVSNGNGGKHIWQSSIPSGSSGNVLNTPKVWGEINPNSEFGPTIKWGDVGGMTGQTLLTVDVAHATIETFGTPRARYTEVTSATFNVAIGLNVIVGINTAAQTLTLCAIGTAVTEADEGCTFVIKNDVTSTNNITVDTSGADTIDGAASVTLLPGESVTVVSDGVSDWKII